MKSRSRYDALGLAGAVTLFTIGIFLKRLVAYFLHRFKATTFGTFIFINWHLSTYQENKPHGRLKATPIRGNHSTSALQGFIRREYLFFKNNDTYQKPMNSQRNTAPPAFKAHPWHGVSPGADCPHRVTAYIEIIPTDVVKYEIDKESGFLKIDRPQKYSNYCPALYGFIPQTYCGERVGELCAQRTGKEIAFGDRDPIDICVLTEKSIQHGDILVKAVPIGGLRLIDKNEADDKIIAVLDQDGVYGKITDVSECPQSVIDSLRHYFLTYKELPGDSPRKIEIAAIYGAEEARTVIAHSRADYQKLFEPSRTAF